MACTVGDLKGKSAYIQGWWYGSWNEWNWRTSDEKLEGVFKFLESWRNTLFELQRPSFVSEQSNFLIEKENCLRLQTSVIMQRNVLLKVFLRFVLFSLRRSFSEALISLPTYQSFQSLALLIHFRSTDRVYFGNVCKENYGKYEAITLDKHSKFRRFL